ncbi:Uncharacterised protein [Oligella ureolytica]|uniref:Rap1a immunity protein domain-containing protein n=2 Tax=Oligella ureolytica TaxID=90244 RepID=A0A378XFH7_9BURK|nr:Rap1a/Tai family immunity protein [Oligella ureolytica]SUA54654.1 Uncharacterised protein [Oligella ureolytica]SUA55745.1 Uncharacterised protein [Oligella ureolytica]
MMKYLSALMLSLSLLTTMVSAEERRDWMMSGSELLKNLGANEASQKLFSDPSLLNAQAQGYVLAIADTENWCLKSQVLPHEIYVQVFTYLNTLDEVALRANASELVRQALYLKCES